MVMAPVGAARGSYPLDDVGVPSPGALAAPGPAHEDHTDSSPVLSPVTEPFSPLPPPSQSVLYEQEVSDLRALAMRFIVAWLNVVEVTRMM